jgi:hypothetical protein
MRTAAKKPLADNAYNEYNINMKFQEIERIILVIIKSILKQAGR